MVPADYTSELAERLGYQGRADRRPASSTYTFIPPYTRNTASRPALTNTWPCTHSARHTRGGGEGSGVFGGTRLWLGTSSSLARVNNVKEDAINSLGDEIMGEDGGGWADQVFFFFFFENCERRKFCRVEDFVLKGMIFWERGWILNEDWLKVIR